MAFCPYVQPVLRVMCLIHTGIFACLLDEVYLCLTRLLRVRFKHSLGRQLQLHNLCASLSRSLLSLSLSLSLSPALENFEAPRGLHPEKAVATRTPLHGERMEPAHRTQRVPRGRGSRPRSAPGARCEGPSPYRRRRRGYMFFSVRHRLHT